MQNALDLINRQQAEIEQLEKDKEKLAISYANAVGKNMTIKAEAIKEFAERLKETIEDYQYVIDNLVREMVGEE